MNYKKKIVSNLNNFNTIFLILKKLVTTLLISNLPKMNDEGQMRNFLNRISHNSGGRICYIHMENCQAGIAFKCKSDALRCEQRVNNRRFYGNILKTKLITNRMANNEQFSTITGPIAQLKNVEQLTSQYKDSYKKLFEINSNCTNKVQNANTCTACLLKNRKLSKYSNFLIRNSLLYVHISMEKLVKNLNILLKNHSGRIPLNALPDCWLNNFDEEFDTSSNPKIIMEHLICSVSNVSIENIEINIDGQKILTRCIIYNEQFASLKELEYEGSTLEMNFDIIDRIRSLLVPNDLTKFPSILINDIEKKYQLTFGEQLNYEQFGYTNMNEFLIVLESKFNKYLYLDDYLLALNCDQLIINFISDLIQKFEIKDSIQNNSEEIERISQNVNNYLKTDLNPEIYGMCFTEDIINAVIQFKEKPYSEVITDLQLNIMKVILNNTKLLNIQNEFIEIGQRFVLIFDEMAALNNELEDNESNLSISIFELYYNYERRYGSINLEHFGTKNISKLFERILSHFFKMKIHTNYCSIYANANNFLVKFSNNWKLKIIRNILILLFQMPKKVISFENLKEYFENKFSFSFGLSLFCDDLLEDIFIVSKNKENKLNIQLNPLYEFASNCLSIMVLHEKIVFGQTNERPIWTIEQLENEFYDHFGISMAYSSKSIKYDINLFSTVDWLFEIDAFKRAIKIRESSFLNEINFNYIPSCNYCEKLSFLNKSNRAFFNQDTPNVVLLDFIN